MIKPVSRLALLSFVSVAAISVACAQDLSYTQELTVPQQCALKLAQPPVIAKLKLSSAQIKAVKAAEKNYDVESKKIASNHSALESERAACDKRFANACLEALTSEQKHQIYRIGIAQIGFPALTDPTIANQLGLSPAQSKTIKDISLSFQKRDEDVSAMIANAITAIPEPKAGEDRAAYDKKCAETAHAYLGEEQRIQRERVAAEKKVIAVLTVPQREKWNDLSGKSK